MTTLNEKKKQFVLAYNGDTADAMRIAGFVGSAHELEKKGNEFLKDPIIADAIRERSKYIASSLRIIAQREEVQAFWTDIMRNHDPNALPEQDKHGTTKPPENIPMANRLKASEFLAKADGQFIERVDIRQQVSFVDLVQDAYDIPDSDLAQIETAYEARRSRKLAAQKMKEEENTIDGDFSDLF